MRPFRYLVFSSSHIYCCELRRSFLRENLFICTHIYEYSIRIILYLSEFLTLIDKNLCCLSSLIIRKLHTSAFIRYLSKTRTGNCILGCDNKTGNCILGCDNKTMFLAYNACLLLGICANRGPCSVNQADIRVDARPLTAILMVLN